MKIGVIGLGLIGGSFALAAKKHLEEVTLFGTDNNPENLKDALQRGIIDQELKNSDYANMDVLILAIPVDSASALILDLLDQINDNALLFDAGSTKALICKKVALHPKAKSIFGNTPHCGYRIFWSFCSFL